MALRWYVVHAYSNFENKVKQSLEERIKREGLEQYFGKILRNSNTLTQLNFGAFHFDTKTSTASFYN